MTDKRVNWPGAVGICCQCFEPINEAELYRHRPDGRKFHKRCFERGGYYVQLELNRTAAGVKVPLENADDMLPRE